MSDEHIDDMLRELRDDLMAVRPSPEFAVKVRQQVAAQPAHKWFGIWQIASAASVVALAALAILLWPSQATKPGLPAPGVLAGQNPTTPSAAVASSTTAAPTSPATVNQATPRNTLVTQPVRVQQVAAREPEVLVPADQRMALIALLDGMRRRGNQVPSETMLEVDSEGRLPAPAEIKVSPITIEPLSPPVPGGGSRERR